jgi:hypothetical protein
MARGELPVTSVVKAGVAPAAETNGDTVNGHQFVNQSGHSFVLVRNADGAAAHNATFITPGTVEGQAIGDLVVNVPASSSKYVGPFSTAFENAGNEVQIDVDSTQLKLSVYNLPV